MKLTLSMDLTNFNRVLGVYIQNSRKEVKSIVGRKFRDVVLRVGKFHMDTRPETLQAIEKRKKDGNLRISKRIIDRVTARRSKFQAELEKQRKYLGRKGKRGELAVFKMMMAAEKLKWTVQQDRWGLEIKQRQDAAGRAGAWGWLVTGAKFDTIESKHPAAVVRKFDGLLETYLEIQNKRPGISSFMDRKGYVEKALGAVAADMAEYLYRKLGIAI
jgi:hypothetical protein